MGCGAEISFWTIFTVLVMLIILVAVVFIVIDYIKKKLVNSAQINYEDYCNTLPPTVYQNAVYIPASEGIYEQKLSLALLEISYAVATTNCTQVSTLPLPPGFTESLEFSTVVNGTKNVVGWVIWDSPTKKCCFAFSGSITPQQFNEDAQFRQVPPTGLNGYVEGQNMLVHYGFYTTYMSVRDQIWSWCNSHSDMTHCFSTGHSLGSSLSQLFSYDVAGFFPNLISYNYAGPKISNPQFMSSFATRVPQNIAVVNLSDLIPNLPPVVIEGWIYENAPQTVNFTASLPSIKETHVNSYSLYMPVCSQNAPCIEDS